MALYLWKTPTCNADELLGLHRHDLLLEKARSSALDQVQVVVHLVGAIERDVQHGAVGQRVELDGGQPRVDDELLGLVARGHVFGGRGVDAQLLDRLDDVDDGGAAADADVLGVLGVVVLDGDPSGSALGCLDVGDGGHGVGVRSGGRDATRRGGSGERLSRGSASARGREGGRRDRKGASCPAYKRRS